MKTNGGISFCSGQSITSEDQNVSLCRHHRRVITPCDQKQREFYSRRNHIVNSQRSGG